jgi:NADH dehydrogenase FAD-containing subunit
MENSTEVISSTFAVVGGGIAGVSCVEQLSLLCPEESTVLVSSSDVVKAVTNLSKVTQWLTTFDVVEESFQEFSTKNINVKVIHADVKKINPSK